ncbi:MAG TPA: nitroreductase/quinone reductase family protein [Candidatus Limnocylindrales bacterium]|nr:nitroreductase/quinone reductase family protein [Candidatus Limnocylindrales bacterium]
MNIPAKKSTLKLTHFGRKSGKPFDVTIWFVVIGGELWIGSLDESRNWVKNLRATGRARIDFGSGPQDVVTEFCDGAHDKARYREAIASKYPVLSRIIGLFVRGKTNAVFRVREK